MFRFLPARRFGALALGIGACAVASPAWALPTPDLLVGLVNIFPLLAGMAVAACTGVYLALKRRLGAERGSFFAGALLGLVVLASVLIVVGLRGAASSRQERRIRDLAIYLRCDYGAHEAIGARRRAPGVENWNDLGNFEWITLVEAEDRFAREPDAATLLATYRWEIEYASGIPAFDVAGKLHLFEFVRRADLAKRLETVTAPDLYLIDFTPYLASPEYFPWPKEGFRKFRHIYVIGDDSGHRHVREDGRVRRADPKRTVEWPVLYEDWIVDQQHVAFPGFARLLEDEEVAKLLKRDDTYVIAPFDGMLRTPAVYRNDYLNVLLADVPRSRVVVVDLGAPDVGIRLDVVARQLDRHPFVVVGISKYDYLYHGLELGHAMWTRLGRDPDRFRLEGFTTRLPEAVARNWVDRSSRDALSYLQEPFDRTLGTLEEALGVPIGIALFLLGALVKLAFFPLGLLEARSRLLRKWITDRERSGGAPWRGSGSVLLRKLRGLRGLEIAGTLVTLLLLLPAYRLITRSDRIAEPFAWIEDLSRGDFGMSAIAAALVLAKLLADGSPSPKIALPLCAAFGLLLVFLPSAVLLYAAGVMAAGALQSLAARAHGRRVLARALLEAR